MDGQFTRDENSAKVDYVVPPESSPREETVSFSAKAQQEKFIGGASEQSLEQASLKSPEKVSNEQLTLKKARTLFFLSFRFSQADGVLQDRIFEYLHSLRPEWSISDEFKEQLKIEVMPSIEDYIRPWESKRILLHRPAGGVTTTTTTMRELERMQEIFNREDTNPPSTLDIAKNIIDRDFTYLCERTSGRTRSPLPKDAPYNP